MPRGVKLKSRLLKFLFFVLLLLTSCAKKTVEIDLTAIDVNNLLSKVREAEESIRTVSGLASVRIESPSKIISYKQVTIAEEPNLLHVEALAPFGRTEVVLISDGKKVYVDFKKEHTEFESVHDFNFSYIYPDLPVTITLENLVNIFLGRLPEKPDYEDSQVFLSKNEHNVVLTLYKDRRKEGILWVNPQNYRVERAILNLENGVTADCEFGDFMDIGNGESIPRSIQLKVDDYLIHLRYEKDVDVNKMLDKELFKRIPSIASNLKMGFGNNIIFDQFL